MSMQAASKIEARNALASLDQHDTPTASHQDRPVSEMKLQAVIRALEVSQVQLIDNEIVKHVEATHRLNDIRHLRIQVKENKLLADHYARLHFHQGRDVQTLRGDLEAAEDVITAQRSLVAGLKGMCAIYRARAEGVGTETAVIQADTPVGQDNAFVSLSDIEITHQDISSNDESVGMKQEQSSGNEVAYLEQMACPMESMLELEDHECNSQPRRGLYEMDEEQEKTKQCI